MPKHLWRVLEAGGLAFVGYLLVTLAVDLTRTLDQPIKRVYVPGGNE